MLKKSILLVFILLNLVCISQTNTPCSSGSPQATLLNVSTTCAYNNGTNVGATLQTNANNAGTPSCSSTGPDVWYSFIAPTSTNVIITTEAGTLTDGAMALYSGTCGSFTELYCDDDSGIGLMPQIYANGLIAGQK